MVLPAVLCAAAVPCAAPVARAEDGAPARKSTIIPKVKPATPSDLDFRPGSMVAVTDEESGGRFLVFTYVVANRTGKTQRFSPRLDLLMGDGTILEAGKDVPVGAARRLRQAAAAPDALDQFQIMGDVLDGEANARAGFAVWPLKGDAKDFTLFVSGTSAAFDRVADPATGKDGIVRRTWSRHYSVPGAPDARSSAEAAFDPIRDAWIMR